MPTGKPDTVAQAQSLMLDQGNATQWWPSTFPSQTVVYPTPSSTEDYANEVEVSEGEHDATLKFYRRRDTTRSHIRTITVPKALLISLAAPRKGSKR